MLNEKFKDNNFSVEEFKDIMDDIIVELSNEQFSDDEKAIELKKSFEEEICNANELQDKLKKDKLPVKIEELKNTLSVDFQLNKIDELINKAKNENIKKNLERQKKNLIDGLKLTKLRRHNLNKKKKYYLSSMRTAAFNKLYLDTEFSYPMTDVYEILVKIFPEDRHILAEKFSILVYDFIMKSNDKLFIYNMLNNINNIPLGLDDRTILMQSIVEICNEKFVK